MTDMSGPQLTVQPGTAPAPALIGSPVVWGSAALVAIAIGLALHMHADVGPAIPVVLAACVFTLMGLVHVLIVRSRDLAQLHERVENLHRDQHQARQQLAHFAVALAPANLAASTAVAAVTHPVRGHQPAGGTDERTTGGHDADRPGSNQQIPARPPLRGTAAATANRQPPAPAPQNPGPRTAPAQPRQASAAVDNSFDGSTAGKSHAPAASATGDTNANSQALSAGNRRELPPGDAGASEPRKWRRPRGGADSHAGEVPSEPRAAMPASAAAPGPGGTGRQHTGVLAAPLDGSAETPVDAPGAMPPDPDWSFQSAHDDAAIRVVADAIEAGRVEVYLQPIVALDGLSTVSYEAFARLKDGDDRLLLPEQFEPLAAQAGLGLEIEQLTIFRTIHLMRQLESRGKLSPVFVNISLPLLTHGNFFREFIDVMKDHRTISSFLILEFSQAAAKAASEAEFESLDALSRLGFTLSLDEVEHIDMDFQPFVERGMAFLKIRAHVFKDGLSATGSLLATNEIRPLFEDAGLQLIVNGIADESSLDIVLQEGVSYGQGMLFGEPRPLKAELVSQSSAAA